MPVKCDSDVTSSYMFCCGLGYDSTSDVCGSQENPFDVGVSAIINNRTSGSTLANSTETASYTATVTATTIDSDTKANASLSSNDVAAVGAGVGIPLALALLAASVMFLRERRQKRFLTVELDALRNTALLTEKRDERIDDVPEMSRLMELSGCAAVDKLHGSDIQEMRAR